MSVDKRFLKHWMNNTIPYDEDRPEGGPFIRLIRDNYYAFVGYSIALISVAIAITFIVKFYLKRRWGISCCTGENRRRNEAAQQLSNDAAVAAQLQRELDAEARREALERKRQARRKEMEGVLSEVTMVVQDENLGREVDLEAGRPACTEDDGEGDMVLKIPGTPGMYRDGHCTICLGEYCAGDKVIWSLNNECLHAFHDDCILTWLSRGKKKCPCCRLHFIPEEEDAKNKDANAAIETATTSDTVESAVFVVEEDLIIDDGAAGEEADDDQRVLAEIIEQRALDTSLERQHEDGVQSTDQ